MKISVIIPVFNRPLKVKRAIESVLSQTYREFELIIIDDGSTDSTPAAIEDCRNASTAAFQVITLPENRGVSAARNTGINASTGEWIALLDSDDEWDRGKLEKQVGFHSTHPELLISQSDERWIRNGEYVNKRKIHEKVSGQFFIESLNLCLISPSAVIFHKDIVYEVGYFDEAFPVCEDYDYWLRVLKKFPVGLLNEQLLTRYGGHDDQLSSQYWGMDRWRVQAMEKHLDSDISLRWQVAVLKVLIRKVKILYQGAVKREKSTAEMYQVKLIEYTEMFNHISTTEDLYI